MARKESKESRAKQKMMQDKRGISPIIATTILISLVVTLSVIVWIFLGGFIKELVTKQERTVETICIEDVAIEAEIGELLQSRLIVTNEGNVPLAGVAVQITGTSNGERVSQKHVYTCPSGIDVGSTSIAAACPFDFNKDFEAEFPGILASCERVKVIPTLLGVGMKSGAQKFSECEGQAKEIACGQSV